jgi:pyruvate dehydrogenase E1 component beta subunit
VDDRWLHTSEEPVPEEAYAAPIGKGAVRREGKDVTVVGLSYLLAEAMRAADELENKGISVEVIDPRTVKPLDKNLILQSLRKTGRLVVADVGWASFGVSGEIAAMAGEEAFGMLKAPVVRVALPDCPAPASRSLEVVYYPRYRQIVDAVLKIM